VAVPAYCVNLMTATLWVFRRSGRIQGRSSHSVSTARLMFDTLWALWRSGRFPGRFSHTWPPPALRHLPRVPNPREVEGSDALKTSRSHAPRGNAGPAALRPHLGKRDACRYIPRPAAPKPTPRPLRGAEDCYRNWIGDFIEDSGVACPRVVGPHHTRTGLDFAYDSVNNGRGESQRCVVTRACVGDGWMNGWVDGCQTSIHSSTHPIIPPGCGRRPR